MPPRVPITTSEQVQMLAVPPIFLVIATIILALRFWARREKRQKYGVDDYLCLAALVVTYCEYASLVVAVGWGGSGIPMQQLKPGNLLFVMKPLLSLSLCWGTAIALIQTSILFLYLRIFKIVTWFPYVCYAYMSLVLMWWASWVVALVTACIPLKVYWTPGLEATCIDMKKFMMGSTISHIILDVGLVLLVIPIIANLKTNAKNKFTVGFALCLALFATSCAIAHLATQINEWDNPDATGKGSIGSVLDVLENTSAVICSSLPAMAFMINRIPSSRVGSSIRRILSRGSASGSRSSLNDGLTRSADDKEAKTSVKRCLESAK